MAEHVTVRIHALSGECVFGPSLLVGTTCLAELKARMEAREGEVPVFLRNGVRLDDEKATLQDLQVEHAEALDLLLIWEFERFPEWAVVQGAGSAEVNGHYERYFNLDSKRHFYMKDGRGFDFNLMIRYLPHSGDRHEGWYIMSVPCGRLFYYGGGAEQSKTDARLPLDAWQACSGKVGAPGSEPGPHITLLSENEATR
eukprot:TRINITY_DN35391_c0_g1_i5.p1 TRINITY_DN35391_c0_g1~~TRINITY_DN35391_c0_g1_i5.p1  ORF type:complete len:199 (-),score=34.76 TRINITY_DN35391_c0_g1_i5:58-654(-)